MSERARLRVFGGGASELRIEQKLITIQVDVGSRGGLVEIIERNRFRSYNMKIDLGGVSWAIKPLRQKFSNKGGVFVEMSKWEAGVKRNNIIIPAGVDVIHGGTRVSNVEREVRTTDKGGHNRNNQSVFSTRRGNSEGNRGASYADVLKSRSSSSNGNNFFLEMHKVVVCTRTDFFDGWA
ncbi:hypothetical protein CsSME_00007127 [Camellia sinensis var. sinensis]